MATNIPITTGPIFSDFQRSLQEAKEQGGQTIYRASTDVFDRSLEARSTREKATSAEASRALGGLKYAVKEILYSTYASNIIEAAQMADKLTNSVFSDRYTEYRNSDTTDAITLDEAISYVKTCEAKVAPEFNIEYEEEPKRLNASALGSFAKEVFANLPQYFPETAKNASS